MSTAALLLLLALQRPAGGSRPAAEPPAAETSPPGAAALPSGDCQTQVKSQIAGSAGAPDPSCWRIGTLSLGMSRFDVRRALGAPDFESDAPRSATNTDRPSSAAVYLFPRNLSTRLAVEPVPTVRYRLLKVTYRNDVVVEIDTHPLQTVVRSACHGAQRRVGGDADANSAVAGFSPFQSFASIQAGQPLTALRRRFGRQPQPDAVRGRYSFANSPLTIEADPHTSRVLGFTLSSDPAAPAGADAPVLTLQRDPMSCLIRGYRFGSPGT